jgi:hypothetical protein
MMARIPPHKALFGHGQGKGLPIGKPLRQNRRGAKYGFALEQANRHLRSLQGAGQGVLLIAEAESHFGRIRQRMPVLRIEKCGAD